MDPDVVVETVSGGSLATTSGSRFNPGTGTARSVMTNYGQKIAPSAEKEEKPSMVSGVLNATSAGCSVPDLTKVVYKGFHETPTSYAGDASKIYEDVDALADALYVCDAAPFLDLFRESQHDGGLGTTNLRFETTPITPLQPREEGSDKWHSYYLVLYKKLCVYVGPVMAQLMAARHVIGRVPGSTLYALGYIPEPLDKVAVATPSETDANAWRRTGAEKVAEEVAGAYGKKQSYREMLQKLLSGRVLFKAYPMAVLVAAEHFGVAPPIHLLQKIPWKSSFNKRFTTEKVLSNGSISSELADSLQRAAGNLSIISVLEMIGRECNFDIAELMRQIALLFTSGEGGDADVRAAFNRHMYPSGAAVEREVYIQCTGPPKAAPSFPLFGRLAPLRLSLHANKIYKMVADKYDPLASVR